MINRRGVVLCLFALGCGAASAPPAVAPRPRVERDVRSSMRGWTGDPRPGELDWMPEAPDGLTGIYGYVLDRERQEPVGGATIVAVDVATGKRMRATSNGLGQFELAGLAPGRYVVTVIARGVRDAWPDVVLDPGKRTALRFHVAATKK
jgi:hypothetical protein